MAQVGPHAKEAHGVSTPDGASITTLVHDA